MTARQMFRQSRTGRTGECRIRHLQCFVDALMEMLRELLEFRDFRPNTINHEWNLGFGQERYMQPTIISRVRRIDGVVSAYEPISGDDPQEAITDIVADIVHWCSVNDIRFEDVLRVARQHADAEWKEAMQ